MTCIHSHNWLLVVAAPHPLVMFHKSAVVDADLPVEAIAAITNMRSLTRLDLSQNFKISKSDKQLFAGAAISIFSRDFFSQIIC